MGLCGGRAPTSGLAAHFRSPVRKHRAACLSSSPLFPNNASSRPATPRPFLPGHGPRAAACPLPQNRVLGSQGRSVGPALGSGRGQAEHTQDQRGRARQRAGTKARPHPRPRTASAVAAGEQRGPGGRGLGGAEKEGWGVGPEPLLPSNQRKAGRPRGPPMQRRLPPSWPACRHCSKRPGPRPSAQIPLTPGP